MWSNLYLYLKKQDYRTMQHDKTDNMPTATDDRQMVYEELIRARASGDDQRVASLISQVWAQSKNHSLVQRELSALGFSALMNINPCDSSRFSRDCAPN
jgi:hypothetical protein